MPKVAELGDGALTNVVSALLPRDAAARGLSPRGGRAPCAGTPPRTRSLHDGEP